MSYILEHLLFSLLSLSSPLDLVFFIYSFFSFFWMHYSLHFKICMSLLFASVKITVGIILGTLYCCFSDTLKKQPRVYVIWLSGGLFCIQNRMQGGKRLNIICGFVCCFHGSFICSWHHCYI